MRCDRGSKTDVPPAGMSEASLERVSQRVRYRHLQHEPQPVAARSLARVLGHRGSFWRTGLARNLLAPLTASWRG